MIINSINNLSLYSSLYSHLPETIDYLKSVNLSQLKEGKNEISDNLYVVKIISEKNSDFKGVLEVHKEWIDIHIPLSTNDFIAFKDIQECTTLEKEYNVENDYALFIEHQTTFVDIPKNYFCIIDTSIAHMAMIGKGPIEKLVFKLKNN